MNRSLRAHEMQMQTSSALKQRQQLRASMLKEKDEELSLFLEMRRREKEQSGLLLNNPEELDYSLASKPGGLQIFDLSSVTPALKAGPDDFLNSDGEKNDYEWLLTPPGTPLFPSLEMETENTVMNQIGAPKARPTALKSRLANSQPELASRGNSVSKQPPSSPGSNSINTGSRRPSSSGGPSSRPGTPTGRPTLTTASKTARPSTPTSCPSLPVTKSSGSVSRSAASVTKRSAPVMKPSSFPITPVAAASKTAVPSRSSTPSRSVARSSTPTRSTARSSTPITARSTIPPPKAISRSSTPTRRTSTPSTAPSVSAAPIKSYPSVTKPALSTSKQPAASRSESPTVRSRPWKPSDMPGFSHDAPPNLRTTLPERPLSATRGRPGAPSSRSSSVEPGLSGRPRRQSCSPSRGRLANGSVVHPSGSSVPAMSRARSKANDNISPVVMGTKMVERVVNMRKLVPPKQDDRHSPQSNLSGKSSSPDSSGFGRTLSKKSLDMAIRHMDIRRSIPGNLRPLMTNIPASSLYSVRSGPSRSKTVSVTGSPHATSSNASSEVSVNNNGTYPDRTEIDDDRGSERCDQSPLTVDGR